MSVRAMCNKNFTGRIDSKTHIKVFFTSLILSNNCRRTGNECLIFFNELLI